jgi:hypothetical protein
MVYEEKATSIVTRIEVKDTPERMDVDQKHFYLPMVIKVFLKNRFTKMLPIVL